MSKRRAKRPSTSRYTAASASCTWLGIIATIGVLNTPGRMVFTRTPSFIRSRAIGSAMASTPLTRSGGIVVHPATHARFDDVRTMVGPKNPTSSVCWCLSHRIPAKDNRELAGPARGAFVESLTRRSTKPWVLAYGLIGMVGWTNRWFNPEKSPVDAATVGRAYADVLLNGLRARS